MIQTDRTDLYKCGACGAELNAGWHKPECPSMRAGWSEKAGSVMAASNAAAEMMGAAKSCAPFAAGTDMEEPLRRLAEWAGELHQKASADLHALFPFQRKEQP